jgi:hypothetical protein
MPEQSAWHTAREPMTMASVAFSMAKLPLIEPLEPPTCMFCGWSSGSTPVEPGEVTTAAPAASARRRTAASWPRVPPPALMTMRSAAAIWPRRLGEDAVVGGHGGCDRRALGQRLQVEAHGLGLRVERQQQIERPGLEGMVDLQGAAAQGVAQGFRRVQDVGAAHQRRQPAVEMLLVLRDLLHVVAFAEGRFVAVDVVDADAVGGRGERAGERLQGAGADRGDDGRRLAILPFERRRGVRHRHFVAAVDGAGDAFLAVDAQDLGEVGRAVAEDREILG